MKSGDHARGTLAQAATHPSCRRSLTWRGTQPLVTRAAQRSSVSIKSACAARTVASARSSARCAAQERHGAVERPRESRMDVQKKLRDVADSFQIWVARVLGFHNTCRSCCRCDRWMCALQQQCDASSRSRSNLLTTVGESEWIRRTRFSTCPVASEDAAHLGLLEGGVSVAKKKAAKKAVKKAPKKAAKKKATKKK